MMTALGSTGPTTDAREATPRQDALRVRVALFSPVWFPVPPTRYGGIEAIVQLLADGLVDAGVDVTLFASGDSETKAELVSAFDTAPSEYIGHSYWELQHLLPFLEMRDEFDLVHDHSGLLGLTMFGLTFGPTLHTVHGPLTGEPGQIYKPRLLTPSTGSGSSRSPSTSGVPAQSSRGSRMSTTRSTSPAIRATAARRRAPLPRADEPRQGRPPCDPDRAAASAARSSIAAKCREPGEIAYFEEYVEPHLDDTIEYVGEVDHDAKCALLAEAHALVVPIEWEEPFGLVMIEALACGTPVIAMRRGSVPEILDHGRTAFIADDLAGHGRRGRACRRARPGRSCGRPPRSVSRSSGWSTATSPPTRR